MKKTDFKVTENILKIKKMVAFYMVLLSFFIPIFLFSIQSITGTLINFFLIFGVLNNFKRLHMFSLIMLPSIGVFLGALLFHKFFLFMLYLIPFIWIANFSFIKVFSYFKKEKNLKNIFSLTIAAFIKTVILFSSAFLLYKMNFVSKIVFLSMGIAQYLTAFTGGLLACGFNKVR